MKRSKFAGLALMGAAPFLLTACGGSPDPTPRTSVANHAAAARADCPPAAVPQPTAAPQPVASLNADYSSVEQCIAGKMFTPEYCRAEYDKALVTHQQSAPRFNDMGSCEAQFGAHNCQSVRQSKGNSWFVPAMAGFVLGQVVAEHREKNRYYNNGGGYYNYVRREPESSPLTTGSHLSTGAFQSTKRPATPPPPPTTSKPVTAKKPATPPPPPPAKVATRSTGGFGSQAAARSSWGS